MILVTHDGLDDSLLRNAATEKAKPAVPAKTTSAPPTRPTAGKAAVPAVPHRKNPVDPKTPPAKRMTTKQPPAKNANTALPVPARAKAAAAAPTPDGAPSDPSAAKAGLPPPLKKQRMHEPVTVPKATPASTAPPPPAPRIKL